MWCLIGCAIGDFGTIGFFQLASIHWGIHWDVLPIMILAMINGLLTSMALETFILWKKHMTFVVALKTAAGMSLLSMLMMETAMNVTDYAITGGAILTWRAVFFALLAGYITPLPYNYWRLKKYGRACH